MQAELPLRGLTLVVTRPHLQAARTALALREAGAAVIEFPVLDIAPVAATLAATELASASGLIFVSANAVAYGVPALRCAGEIPAGAKIFAIGRATATALADAGFSDVVSPQRNVVPPQCDVVPPERDVGTPQCNVVSPQRDVVPPQCDVVPPRCDVVPPLA